jgi:thioredoxin reductase
MRTHDVVIIGSGPAGLTAALYTARANLRPLLIEGFEAGGQLMLTTLVENFPGYRDGIMGPDLMGEMRAQAEKFGAEFVQGNVTEVDLCVQPIAIKTADAAFSAKSLIIATGASAKLLGLPAERALMGHGVSTCATCDGYFFRGHEIAVVGGGDSAMEEAVFLTKFASKVTIVHRRDTLRASKIMQDKARANPKIAWALDSEVEDITDTAKGEVRSMRRRSSAASSKWTPTATSSRTTAPRRACRGCLRAATCRTTFTGRRSRPPGQAAWRHSTPSTISKASLSISRRRPSQRRPSRSTRRRPRHHLRRRPPPARA